MDTLTAILTDADALGGDIARHADRAYADAANRGAATITALAAARAVVDAADPCATAAAFTLDTPKARLHDTIVDLVGNEHAAVSFGVVGPDDNRTVRMTTVCFGDQATVALPAMPVTAWLDIAESVQRVAVFHDDAATRARARNVHTALLALAGDTEAGWIAS